MASAGGRGGGAVAPDAVDQGDSVEFCCGRAIAGTVSYRRLEAEFPVHRQASPCETGVIHTGIETSFCLTDDYLVCWVE